MNKNESVKPFFAERICAIILDMLIVSTIASLVVFPFLDSKAITKLNNQALEVIDSYDENKINTETYFSERISILYQTARTNGIVTIIQIIIMILYFMVYQFYNDGQTIGKKIMKIKVVNNDEDMPLTMNNIVIRSLIINSILMNMISLSFAIFSEQYVYFYGVFIFEVIQYAVIVISLLLIIIGKQGRGVHDMIARTKVIKTNVVKELETCES